MNDIWIVADTHFNHKNILEANSSWGWRPFDGIEEMREVFIRNWNEVVHPGDRVMHVGDFQFIWNQKNPEDASIARRLNGQIFLLEGNHDQVDQWSEELKQQFVVIQDRYCLKVKEQGSGGEKLYMILDHYPLRSWDGKLKGALHCHGHVHGTLNSCPLPRSLDVCIDNANEKLGTWRPFHLDEVLTHVHSSRFWKMVERASDQSNPERFLLDWEPD